MTTRGRARRASLPPLAVEGALLLPALAAGIGLGRLGTAPSAGTVVTPIALSVVVGHMVTAAAGRRLGRALGSIVGVAGVALVAVWWFFPSTTAWGVPTATTADQAGHALQAAWALIGAEPTPVQAVPAIVLCMAIGAGLAAVCARSLFVAPSPSTSRSRGALLPLLALVPTASVFGYASLLDSGSDRPQAALAYVVAVGVFAAVLGAAGSGPLDTEASGVRAAPPPRLRAPRLLTVGGLAAAVGVSLVVVPSLSSLRPRPFVAAADGGIGTVRALAPLYGGVDSIALVDDVGAVLQQRPRQLLFVARTPVPTYWQLATLTTFDGGRWLGDPETAAAVEGTALPGLQLPGLVQPPPPAGAAFYDASVTVQNMQSVLLPVPPSAVSVASAGGRAQLVAGLGARLLTGSSFGLRYEVRVASGFRPAPRPPTSAELAPYLQLPQISPDVVALTRRVVAKSADPLRKAEALDTFFARGGFRYSLTADVPGPDPLEAFLLGTKTGFCQQFAGAYGVMARLAGLPTRLAVGFTAGVPGPGGYEVTGADAHVWPEVYLGRNRGWVSVDPTPPAPGVITTPAPDVLSASAGSNLGADELPVARLAPHGSPSTGPAPPSPRASTAAPRPAGFSSPRRSHAGSWETAVLVLIVVLSVLALARRRLASLVRRAGWRRLPPHRAVLAMWMDAAGTMGRRAQETPHEHAERVVPEIGADVGAFVELARLAAWAGYSGEEVTDEHCAEARRLYAGATRR